VVPNGKGMVMEPHFVGQFGSDNGWVAALI
jgi:hypothetical protein